MGFHAGSKTKKWPSRVVVVGSGSAGRRHVAALRSVLPDALIMVVRRPGSVQPIEELLAAGVQLVDRLDGAVESGVDVAVVASPAPFHVDHANALAMAGAAVLIEKPLAVSLRQADAIPDDLVHRFVVGYHLRLHAGVVALRDAVSAGVVGEPRWFDFEVGQHLDLWRPGVDASRSVSARADLGGGVLLELSHELDALSFVLGSQLGAPRVTRADVGFDGAPSDGIVETVARLELAGSSGLSGRVRLDMVSRSPRRIWTIAGATGVLTLDLMAGSLTVRHDDQSEMLFRSPADERDNAEARLIANLLEVWRGDERPVCDVSEARRALELIATARQLAGEAR